MLNYTDDAKLLINKCNINPIEFEEWFFKIVALININEPDIMKYLALKDKNQIHLKDYDKRLKKLLSIRGWGSSICNAITGFDEDELENWFCSWFLIDYHYVVEYIAMECLGG